MEIYERIRYLRKHELSLSQSEFGQKLGVNRDVINNIENDRLKRPDQKEPLYKLICKEFHVSYDWLINGNGYPFCEDGLEDEYVRATAEIDIKDPRARKAIIDYWHLTDEDKELYWNFVNRFVKKEQEV